MNSDNDNTLKLGTSILAHLVATRPHDKRIELYPTANNPSFQFLPGIYKYHLYGIFYHFKLIDPRKNGTRCKDVIDWTNKFPGFSFEKIKEYGVVKMFLVHSTTKLSSLVHSNFRTRRNRDILQRLRKKLITKLESLDDKQFRTAEEQALEESDTQEQHKRRTVSIGNEFEIEEQQTAQQERGQQEEQEQEIDQDMTNLKIVPKTIGGRELSIQIPKHFSIMTSYKEKMLFEQIDRLTRNLENVKTENERENDRKESELEQSKSELRTKDVITSQLRNKIVTQEKIITELQGEKERNKERIAIGDIILNLPIRFPKETGKCPGNSEAKRLYGLGWAQIPAASAKYLAIAIPTFVAAFLTDIGLSKYIPDLELIPTITPSDKCLDECILLLHEFVCYKIASYVNKGAICSCTHDKGERKKLGRLIRLLAFLNKGFKLDPNFHDGIISLRVDSNGVKSEDVSIVVQHLYNSFERSKPYIDEGKSIKISSFTTDAGGGGGTKESCANKFVTSHEGLIFEIWYVITCMLHGHSKPLEKAWLEGLGEFGNGKRSASQYIYQCWYIQDRLGENFKTMWNKLTGNAWIGNILKRPVLTRWGYPLGTCSRVNNEYDTWLFFLTKLYEGESAQSEIGKTIQMAIELGKNPETKCQVSFITAFGDLFWTSGRYNWIRRKDERTKLEGHSCHEILVQVFIMSMQLKKLENGRWKNEETFNECVTLCSLL